MGGMKIFKGKESRIEEFFLEFSLAQFLLTLYTAIK